MRNKLIKLLELESSELVASYKKASLEGQGTPQEVADRREECFKSFLQKYFPFPYRIVKGNIVDSLGNQSQSIDCIVINPKHPYTIDGKNDRASVIFAEGTDYAIEIKPDLSSQKEIERALIQIQSVKKLRRVTDGLLFHKNYNEEQLTCAKTVPGIIVADKTYADIRKLLEYIAEYYIKNNVPFIEQFDLLFVNQRTLVYNNRPNSYISYFKENGLFFVENADSLLSLFLFELNCISQSAPLLSDNIMRIYLQNTRPENVKTFSDINKKLQDGCAKK